jgi:hypothetical protein
MKKHVITVVRSPSALAKLILFLVLGVMTAQAQLTNVVFSDDFAGSSIDSAKWAVDAPVFEGGKGNIAPTQRDGILEFSGTVTEQWWAGATLRALPVFPVSAETNVIVTVDRVQEGGVGTASRSALWIMDSTQTKYILFADVRGEMNWRYNRKTGLPGDVPTGGGTDIAAFNGGTFDDCELHQMKAVANGKTVRLYLDGKAGPNVTFPFDGLVFHVGSYARATDDTAYTVFDNFKVETVGVAAFSASTTTLLSGQTTSNITVHIPRGVNAGQDIAVRVVSSDTNVAIPVGAIGDTLTMTFPQAA